MNNEQKMMWMFEQVHGKITGSCYTELFYDEYDELAGVNVMKDGNLCWSVPKLNLVFDYLTKHLEVR